MHGFVATGTMGEAGSLTARRAPRPSSRPWSAAAAGRVPVIAGVSSGTPRASIGFAADAEAAGADAIMLLPPLGYRGRRARDDRLLPRGRRGRPTCRSWLYNNPEASGTDLPPALIARIAAEVDQVVAVKECSGDARRIAALLADDRSSRCSWAATTGRSRASAPGATGWVSGVADCAPAECVELYEACRRRRPRARPRDLRAAAPARAGST